MRRTSFLLALVATLWASACSDRGDCPEIPDGYAAEPNAALLGYRRAVVTSSVEEMEKVLHPSFEFTFPQLDADSLGIVRFWDRDEELAIATRLFDGLEGVRVDSTCQPPPDPSIGLQLNFNPAPYGPDPTVWEFVSSGAHAGSWRREFGAVGQLLDANGLLDFIDAIQVIYVREVALFGPEDSCPRVWQIVAWEDLGPPAAAPKHGVFGWGRVKARWRSDAPEPLDCP